MPISRFHIARRCLHRLRSTWIQATGMQWTCLTHHLNNFLMLEYSELNAKITLSASHRPAKHGMPNYRGHVQNFNGPITLDIGYDEASTDIIPIDFRVSAPPSLSFHRNLSSNHTLQVTNNQGACDVSLDDHFRGPFEASTKLGSVKLDERDEDEHLSLQYDQNTNTAKRGWIGSGTRPNYWDPAAESMLKVSSSLSTVHLRLGSIRT